MGIKLFNYFKGEKSRREESIKEYFKKGWLHESLNDPKLFLGFLNQIEELETAGFNYQDIQEIASLGQIEFDEGLFESIKQSLIKGTFKGGCDPQKFDIGKDYINLDQLVLQSGDVYVTASSSPAEYWGTQVGIIWKQRLDKPVDIESTPKCSIVYRNH